MQHSDSCKSVDLGAHMATIGSFEAHIRSVEGFDIRVRHLDGRDVRSDYQIRITYDFEKRSANTQTVSDWRRLRAETSIAGFTADVLLADGTAAHGATLLSTVRASYGN